MSYILDALRRADAERDRGAVPGLHTQPAFNGSLPGSAPRGAVPPWGWIGAGVLLAVVAIAAGWFWRDRGRSASDVGIAAAPLATAPIGTAPGVGSPVGATTRSIAAEPAVPPPDTAPIAPRVARSATTPPSSVGGSVASAQRPHLEPRTAAAGTMAAAPGSRTEAHAAVAASSAPRIVALAELPDDVRRQLPPVNVGGSSYSSTPANRVLIVNGQVLHEGDTLAPGVVLQQIRLKGAVLAFAGYRFEIAY